VWFNDGTEGGEDLFAIVTEDNGGDNLNLLVADNNGAFGYHNSVPRREKSDYDEAGGGDTWHIDK